MPNNFKHPNPPLRKYENEARRKVANVATNATRMRSAYNIIKAMATAAGWDGKDYNWLDEFVDKLGKETS